MNGTSLHPPFVRLVLHLRKQLCSVRGASRSTTCPAKRGREQPPSTGDRRSTRRRHAAPERTASPPPPTNASAPATIPTATLRTAGPLSTPPTPAALATPNRRISHASTSALSPVTASTGGGGRVGATMGCPSSLGSVTGHVAAPPDGGPRGSLVVRGPSGGAGADGLDGAPAGNGRGSTDGVGGGSCTDGGRRAPPVGTAARGTGYRHRQRVPLWAPAPAGLGGCGACRRRRCGCNCHRGCNCSGG